MGYISNANGLRLTVSKGWYHKLISNKFLTDNINITNIINSKDFVSKVLKKKKYRGSRYKIIIAGKSKLNTNMTNRFNLAVNYLTFEHFIEHSIELQIKFLAAGIRTRTRSERSVKNYLYFYRMHPDWLPSLNHLYAKLRKAFLPKRRYIMAIALSYKFTKYEQKLYKYQQIFNNYTNKILQLHYKTISKFKSDSFQKIFFSTKNKTFFKIQKAKTFNFITKPKHYSGMNSQFVADYYIKKLRAQYKLYQTQKPLIKELKNVFFIKGVNVRTRGRFAKTQRASYKNAKFGAVSLNTLSEPINYDFRTIPLRYGVGSIKVWVNNRVIGRRQILKYHKK